MSASSFAGKPGSRPAAPLFLGALVCAATVVLVWLGYRATAEWQRSDAQVVARRASETLALVSAALNRDMKGTHASILASIHLSQLLRDAPYDLADEFGAAFARFPYPESFFVWTGRTGPAGTATFFNRADRPPAWQADVESGVAYPVLITEEPAAAIGVIEAVRRGATLRRPFVIQEVTLGHVRYQVVAHALYAGPAGADLAGIIGYTVNLDWVRAHYFGDLIRQVSTIGGGSDDVAVVVLDSSGDIVGATAEIPRHGITQTRQFPLSFFDPALVPAPNRPADREFWTIQVGAALDSRSMGADTTRWMFVVIALAAAAAMVGLFLTMRAVRVTAEVAALQSEFVSTVTHEIKTPIAGIKLVAETLAMGRCTSPDAVREYGKLLSHEAGRLTQLIENLLAYARVSNVNQAYSFESVEPGELVDEALHRCRLRIVELGFKLDNVVPSDLPRIRADRSAIVQVLENIIDNAINYSNEARMLAVSGHLEQGAVHLAVRDAGPGIPADELPRVFDKFFRGRHARTDGSGLGLTIARRIVEDHGGHLNVDSAPSQGTTVRIVLPAEAS